MLEKLLLAFTITIGLNLFLGARLPNATTSSQVAETPTSPIRLLLDQGLSTAIRRHNQTTFCLQNLLPPTRGS